MGTFFKSFWGQLGRSTGKRVSNAIYGDKWSTPYRVAVNKEKKQRKKEPSRRREKVSETHHQGNVESTSKSLNKGCMYWIIGLVLFAGTYHAILYPSRDDVVLIIMLWIVVIAFFLFKYLKTHR